MPPKSKIDFGFILVTTILACIAAAFGLIGVLLVGGWLGWR